MFDTSTILTTDRHVVWRGRFKSAPVSRDEYLIACSRYIELNPFRAGLVEHAKDYRWSSYLCRGLGIPVRLLDEDPWHTGLGRTEQERQHEYRQWIDCQVDQKEWDEIRQATQRGSLDRKRNISETGRSNDWPAFVGEAGGRPRKRNLITIEKVL